jgi:hypothetical protein
MTFSEALKGKRCVVVFAPEATNEWPLTTAWPPEWPAGPWRAAVSRAIVVAVEMPMVCLTESRWRDQPHVWVHCSQIKYVALDPSEAPWWFSKENAP